MFTRLALVAMMVGVLSHRAPIDTRAIVADRVMKLTRESPWKRIAAVPIAFRTFHPQGLVKIGDTLYVSSVDVTVRTTRFAAPRGGFDRDAGEGVGHLFKIDAMGRLMADARLGERTMYHPGGLDYDGTSIWCPVSEYRPNSRSIVYRIDPVTLRATEVLRFADHLGAIVYDTDDRMLHGISWGSRWFYRWTLDRNGAVINAGADPASIRALNSSHYIDYQDCKYAGARRMLCTGVADLRQSADGAPFRLGGLELVDLTTGHPLHQVPVPLWTPSGLDMTHNPVWIEPSATGLRAYFIPEDDVSTLYIYEVDPG
jgi:hypothetical protein